MRCLSIATVIGAALFSVTASATTLTVLPTIYDSPRSITISIRVTGNAPKGDVVLFYGGIDGPLGGAPVMDGVAVIRVSFWCCGPRMISATYSGDNANPSAHLNFTVGGDRIGWLPAALEDLLPD